MLNISSMLIKLILIPIATYLGLIVFAAIISNKAIFPNVPVSYEDDANILKLKTSNGAIITAKYLEAPESKKLLLYSHGNGEDIGMILEHMKEFQRRGISVLFYDYPGYGTSSDKPTEPGVYDAADAIYRFANETLNFQPDQIVLYGYSLGSGPSCWLAERYPVSRLILEGAFSSTFRVVTRVKFLPLDKFDNHSRFKNIKCPVLLIHGTKDRIVPFWNAKKNWKALSGEKQKFWVEGAGHTNLAETAGEDYWNTVSEFIQRRSNI